MGLLHTRHIEAGRSAVIPVPISSVVAALESLQFKAVDAQCYLATSASTTPGIGWTSEVTIALRRRARIRAKGEAETAVEVAFTADMGGGQGPFQKCAWPRATGRREARAAAEEIMAEVRKAAINHSEMRQDLDRIVGA